MLKSPEMQGIEVQCINLLRDADPGGTTDTPLLLPHVRVPIKKDIKQDNATSPKLFIESLEMIIRATDWTGGLSINIEPLIYL